MKPSKSVAKNETATATTQVQVNGVQMSVEQSEQLKAHLETSKSNAIRYLAQQRFTTSAIAKILDIRYQHARNVLSTPVAAGRAKSSTTLKIVPVEQPKADENQEVQAETNAVAAQ